MRGLPTIGTRFTARYKGQDYTAEIVATDDEPKVLVAGIADPFGSLSAAGAAVTGCATNGNRFWKPVGAPEKEPEKEYEVVGVIVREKKIEDRTPDPELPTETPGPEADGPTLMVWYRDVVQRFIATHAYEDHIILCRWCLADEDHTVKERGSRMGTFKYCSDRCADAAAAYIDKVLRKGDDRPVAPPAEEEGDDDLVQ